MDEKRIGNDKDRKNMKRMKQVQEDEIKNGQNSMLPSIARKHESRK